MRPTPPLDSLPSSPSSLWSCAHSANHDRHPPLTPDSYSPVPAPTIVTPDEFALEFDVQLDKMVASPHKPRLTRSFPQPSLPSPKMDPCFMSGDDMSKVQVFLRNRGRWESMRDRLESSPPLRSHNAPPVLALSQDSTGDDSSWEVAQSALVDPDELPDPSRCSLLIHEVSLLVGLTADEDHLPPDDPCLPVPAASRQLHNILPLTLTPTKSLASGKHRNAGLPRPTNRNIPILSSDIPIPPGITPHADIVSQGLYHERSPPVASGDLATPIPRHKHTDAPRPNLSPRRRQGQVFHFEPPLSNVSYRNPVDLDKTFCYPRDPPPTPISTPAANRCSSLDRLECSLVKLQAHAPCNHRGSHSEGSSSVHVAERMGKRPSLPPPRRLKQHQSSHEIMHRRPSRSGHGCYFQTPPPIPTTPHQYVAPQICPAATLDDDLFEEDLTPGSFMDMDIPQVGEAWEKRRTSFRQVNSKEKMKSLVNVAKRVSRGVISWGKHLTGSRKLPQETTTVESAHV